MTSHQRYAYACATLAILLGAGALTLGTRGHHLPAAGLAYSAAVLAWAGLREHQAHRRLLLEREWKRRRAIGGNPAPLNPCCLWAATSSGAAHDPRPGRCTRDRRFEEQIADFYDDHQDGAA